MKTSLLLAAALAVLCTAGSAHAEDLGFRFDARSGRCLDSAGAEGMNPGFLGVCGDLHGQDLSGAYLLGVDLRGADLSGANLAKAHLSRADLTGADLHGAVLEGAYLNRTNFTNADLRCVTFQKALKGADLHGATLTGARFCPATELPFAVEVALARGMTLVGGEAVSMR